MGKSLFIYVNGTWKECTPYLNVGSTWKRVLEFNAKTAEAWKPWKSEEHVHTKVIIPEVAPTCTATGLTEGSKCSSCGQILVEQMTVNANGHTEVIDKAVAPTCTSTGLTEGKHCSVCDEVLLAQIVVAAEGHTEDPDRYLTTSTKHANMCEVCEKATTTYENHVVKSWTKNIDIEAGLVTLSGTCTVCNNTATHTHSLTGTGDCPYCDESVWSVCCNKLDVHNYTFANPDASPSTSYCTTYFTIIYTCPDHGETLNSIQGQVHNSFGDWQTDDDGTIYRICEDCGHREEQTHIHSYTVNYTWNGSKCTAKAVCSCGNQITETKTGSYNSLNAATCCTVASWDYYITSSTWNNSIFGYSCSPTHYGTSYDYTNHTDLISSGSWDATCSTPGWKSYKYCNDCGKYYNTDGTETTWEELEIPEDPDTHFNLTAITAKAATCTTDGHKAHSYCSGCKKYYVNGKLTDWNNIKIPASHTPDNKWHSDEDSIQHWHECTICGTYLDYQDHTTTETGGDCMTASRIICTTGCGYNEVGSKKKDNHVTKLTGDEYCDVTVRCTCGTILKSATEHVINTLSCDSPDEMAQMYCLNCTEPMIGYVYRPEHNWILSPDGGQICKVCKQTNGSSGGSGSGSGSGSGGCVFPGTKIALTADTSIDIADFKGGMAIDFCNPDTLEHFQQQTVAKLFSKQATEKVIITLEDGKALELTPNHVVLTTEGFKDYLDNSQFPKYHIGDKLATIDGYKELVEIQEETIEQTTVYNIATENSLMVANGIIVASELDYDPTSIILIDDSPVVDKDNMTKD